MVKKASTPPSAAPESPEPEASPASHAPESDPVEDAVKRMAFNLKQLEGMTHSPDCVRQLQEDFAILRGAAGH